VLVRHDLLDAVPHRWPRADYRRWQRVVPMELWQLTSSMASGWPTGRRPRSSPEWTTIPGSA